MINKTFTNSKEWYKSKTLWTNIIAIIIAVLTGITNLISTGQAITFIAVVNILLRFITTHKLTINGK